MKASGTSGPQGGITRRGAHRLITGAVAASLGGVSLVSQTARAQGKPRSVKIAISTPQINDTYFPVTIPVALGWWKKQGYDVELIQTSGGAQNLQMMAAKTIDIAFVNASAIVGAVTQNDLPVRVVMQNGIVDWQLVTLDGSPIKKVGDFKGKTIGVLSLATGGVLFLKQLLAESGLDPDKDVTLVATGGGATALEALRRDRVQGLMYWGSLIASLENIGAKFQSFRSENWLKMPDFSLVAMNDVIKNDGKMVEDIIRGAAQASAFTFANPDCARLAQWKWKPDSKPSGQVDEATLVRWDMNVLEAQVYSFKKGAELNGGRLAATLPGPMGRLQDLLFDNKVIPKKVDPSLYVIEDKTFFDRVNNFDRSEFEAQAKACKI